MSIPTLSETSKMNENRHGNSYYAYVIRSSFHFKTLRESEQVLVYEDGIYKSGGEIIIKEECQKIIPDCKKHNCNEVINTIRRETYVPRDQEFDNHENLVNLRNGILNLQTQQLSPHSHNFLFRIQLPITYDQNATCEQFIRFLEQCHPDEKNRITALEAFASTLLPNIHLEKMFMNVGSGANGKSTYLKVIEQFLGTDNVSNISIHDMESDRFAKAGLVGKFANIYADISRRELPELASVKAVISSDSISVQRKGEHRFTMRNTAKLIFSCNELPELGEDSHAVYRRLVLIEWNERFSHQDKHHKINPNLFKELTTEQELSGILNLLLQHTQKISKNGKLTYDETALKLRGIWAQKADPIGTFLDSCVEQDFETKTSKASIFQAFCSWCKSNKITPKKQKQFNYKVSQKFAIQDTIGRIENKTTRLWEGIKVVSA
uniref:Putative Poxvirus D5 protein-like protein n=1 Tax=uncultured marine crenarchaeote HF4000_APKG6D9 TaxID=455597 RepID=B3T949_9ARCH|nr:putative Poxvirus D5 protein-like protein [uncultured marine crenarchaeote HF4000_APKG6D9]